MSNERFIYEQYKMTLDTCSKQVKLYKLDSNDERMSFRSLTVKCEKLKSIIINNSTHLNRTYHLVNHSINSINSNQTVNIKDYLKRSSTKNYSKCNSIFYVLLNYLFILFLNINSVRSSGLFELDIIKYENYFLNETIHYTPVQSISLWHHLTNWSSINHLNSNLIYNLCLKEPKARILGKPCTFGETQISANLLNQPVSLKELITFRWTKSITLILTILKLDEKTSELKQIDKHIHFDSNLIPKQNQSDQHQWTYKLSIHSFSRLLYRFRITCSSNYYGEDCSRFCRERNDLFGHYLCNKDGKQICLNGWRGEQCDQPICSANCSMYNGYCKKPNECLCKPGYKGIDCTECIPHQNCLNGYCNQPNQCICKTNWGGLFCDLDLNLCSNHQPCLNNGLCNSIAPNQYKCTCLPGYGGTNCEIILDICLTKPCLNEGKCIRTTNYTSPFKCNCQSNWTGERCETNLNSCIEQSNPCGQCVDTQDGNYQCKCDRGFTGTMCDQNIDECAQSVNDQSCVMSNTERCIDTVGSFECRCLPGWSGKYCQVNIDDCASNPCLNNAQQCIDLVNDYKCICSKEFKGKNCGQFDESVCESLVANNETALFFENNLNHSNEEQNQYWQIDPEEKLNKSKDCKSRWCTCSTINHALDSSSINQSSENKQANRKNLICICIKEDEYERLNRRQLDKLNLALNPVVDQLMLVDNRELDQQNYLIEQLKLRKQNILKNNAEDERKINETLSGRPNESNELNQIMIESKETNEKLINEILIDNHFDLGDDLFVSLTINFGQKLINNQAQSICSSMLAIYSLICNQPDLEQLNFVCKIYNNENQRTSIRFYTLDNDERVLSIAEIIQKSLNNYRLLSILKRTYRLSNNLETKQLTKWQLHYLIVMNVCFLFWLIVILMMIYILLSTHNERLRSILGKNRLLNLISLQLNKRVYNRKSEPDMQLNKSNQIYSSNNANLIVIHNDLTKIRTKNEYVLNNQFNQKSSQKPIKLNEQNKLTNFKQQINLNLDKDQKLSSNYFKIYNDLNDPKLIDQNELIKDNYPKYPSRSKNSDHILKSIKPVHL